MAGLGIVTLAEGLKLVTAQTVGLGVPYGPMTVMAMPERPRGPACTYPWEIRSITNSSSKLEERHTIILVFQLGHPAQEGNKDENYFYRSNIAAWYHRSCSSSVGRFVR
jgi:hypothetical protein